MLPVNPADICSLPVDPGLGGDLPQRDVQPLWVVVSAPSLDKSSGLNRGDKGSLNLDLSTAVERCKRTYL